MEAERAQPVLSGLRSDFLSCLMTGMMELDLLGFNENTQFFVCKHRDYGENGALDEIERQNAEQQVHAHAGNARVDRRAKLKDSVQIPAHAVHIERNDQEVCEPQGMTGVNPDRRS